jgi:hypothetical protein
MAGIGAEKWLEIMFQEWRSLDPKVRKHIVKGALGPLARETAAETTLMNIPADERRAIAEWLNKHPESWPYDIT